jgi:hypothetical protein
VGIFVIGVFLVEVICFMRSSGSASRRAISPVMVPSKTV